MYNVYIVDDEYEIRNGLVSFFPWEMLGFQVAGQAENGEKAMEYLLRHREQVDVVLADIRMPVMDGLTLVEKIRESGIDCQIILLSAHSDFEYARSALRHGVFDYMLKPTEYKKLITLFQRLKTYLDRNAEKAESEENSRAYRQSTVELAVSYMKMNYADASLESIAAYVGLSPSYFSTLFVKETGVGFQDYLIRIKMEEAARMLMDMNARTYDISEKRGYSNAKNFARIFKKYYGISPREYRLGKLNHET